MEFVVALFLGGIAASVVVDAASLVLVVLFVEACFFCGHVFVIVVLSLE